MESRKVVTSPAQEGPVKAKPDDFEPQTTTSTQTVDDPLQAKPPAQAYSIPPKDPGGEGGERH